MRIDLRRLCQQLSVQFEGAAATLHPRERAVVTEEGRRFRYDLAAFNVGVRMPGTPEQGPVVPTKPLLLSIGAPVTLRVAGNSGFKGRPLLRLKHFIDCRWMRFCHTGRWQNGGLHDWLRAKAPLNAAR